MLVGRDLVLQAGEAAVESALRGHGRLLLLTGEAGIGKTAVARALAERAGMAGAVVRWGAAWEGQEALPFGPWIEGLRRPGGDTCAAAADRLTDGGFEAGGDGTTTRNRSRFYTAVVHAIAEAATARPQVLVLDDLHWADPASLDLLAAVAAHLPALRALIVGTYRPEELPPGAPLGAIGGNAERFSLEGLAAEHVTELLTGVLGRAPAEDETRAIHHDTGGNPLFVTELGRLWAAGSPAGVPASARQVLDRRLAHLSSASHRVLGAAAVLGATFDTAALSGLAGGDTDVMRALDEARAARLLTPAGDGPSRWSFVHPLFRTARYEALGADERSELHRRALDVLGGNAAVPAGLLAHHVLRARVDPSDPRPAEILVAAAREATARLASDEAVHLAERARDLAPPGPAGDGLRAEAWLAAGAGHLRGADGDAAAAAFEAAAALGRRLGRPELVAAAALGFGAGLGGFEVRVLDRRQLDLLEEAAGALPADSPTRPLVLARLSVALSFTGSDERRLALADAAVEGARGSGDGRALAAAIAARCDAVAGPDHVAERLAAASEIVALARRAGDLPLELLGRRLRVVALLEQRDLAGLRAEERAFARCAERLGDPLYGWYVPMWRARDAYAAGDLDGALRLAAEAGEMGRPAGSVNVEMLRVSMAFFAGIDRRDAAAVEAAWEEMLAVHPDFAPVMAPPTRILADAACGHVGRARAALERSGLDVAATQPRDQEWLANLAQLVTASVISGYNPVVRRCCELLAPYAGLGVFEGVAAIDHGVVDRFLALAAGHLGDLDAARGHVDAALEGVAGAGRLVVAHTRADSARALQAGPDPDRRLARDLAEAAATDYEALGLDALAGEVRQLAAGGAGLPATGVTAPAGNRTPALRRDGDTWVFTFEGSSARIRHAKGIADLAVLLARPGRDVHVRELEGDRGPGTGGADDPALDGTALARYRRRLRDLEEELDEADRFADVARATKLAAERDALVEQLTAGLGLGGRRRRAGPDPDERLRKAVSARVKATLDRLDGLHPRLARHLRASVRTGFWCRYEPEQPLDWEVVTRSP